MLLEFPELGQFHFFLIAKKSVLHWDVQWIVNTWTRVFKYKNKRIALSMVLQANWANSSDLISNIQISAIWYVLLKLNITLNMKFNHIQSTKGFFWQSHAIRVLDYAEKSMRKTVWNMEIALNKIYGMRFNDWRVF